MSGLVKNSTELRRTPSGALGCGTKPGPYFYLVNDPPGASRSGKDVRFVVLCQHDHGDLALYVYVEDDGPPTVADAAHNPHYDLRLAKAGP